MRERLPAALEMDDEIMIETSQHHEATDHDDLDDDCRSNNELPSQRIDKNNENKETAAVEEAKQEVNQEDK